MRLFKILLEQLSVKFRELRPFVAVRAGQGAIISGGLHRADLFLGRDIVAHFISQEFGAEDLLVKAHVVGDEAFRQGDGRLEFKQHQRQ